MKKRILNKHIRNHERWNWPLSLSISLGAISLAVLFAATQTGNVSAPSPEASHKYPVHHGIIASMFYVGEKATADNGYIANIASTWDEAWAQHYGGVDTPDQREGWRPAAFLPKENPFYIALPYNDLNEDGTRKDSANKVYWHSESGSGSWVKNRWVEVCKDDQCAYGQWEDAGPFGEDDVDYVFGSAKPSNTQGLKAGIDVSPAIDQYLDLKGSGVVTWRFVETPPPGPWREAVSR